MTSATLTWQPSGEETQWLVSWSTDGGSTWSTDVTENECSYELTGLSGGTTVRVKVQAIFGEGLYSVPATCTFSTALTPVNYLAADGTTQTCLNYTVLTGSESELAEGWYVAEGNVSFDHQLSASDGDIHLILKDGAVMRIGTEQSPVSDYGIYANGHSICIHGQSTGESRGQLWINATDYGIYAQGGNVEISGGQVEAKGTNYAGIYAYKINNKGGSISMTDATVTAEGATNGIYTSGGHLTAEDCTINATSTNDYGIYSYHANITLTDCEVTATGGDMGIYANGGNVEISGGTVEAKGTKNYGIYATQSNNNGGSISMTGATVTAEGFAYGIYTSGGHLTAEGCAINATSTNSYGIYSSNGNITLTDCEVTATGSDMGIFAQGGNVEISGGTVEAKGTKEFGIYATQGNNNGGSISMTGATVTTEGANYGIWASGDHLTAEGCTINATGTTGYGIYSYNGNITLTDCEVTATGGTYGIYTCGGNVEIRMASIPLAASPSAGMRPPTSSRPAAIMHVAPSPSPRTSPTATATSSTAAPSRLQPSTGRSCCPTMVPST